MIEVQIIMKWTAMNARIFFDCNQVQLAKQMHWKFNSPFRLEKKGELKELNEWTFNSIDSLNNWKNKSYFADRIGLDRVTAWLPRCLD